MEDLCKIKVEGIDVEENYIEEPGTSRSILLPRPSQQRTRLIRATKKPGSYTDVVAEPSWITPYKNKKGKDKINDNRGVHIASGKDVCNCLEEGCPRYHFACRKCKSTRGGVECRTNRKYPIECVVIEGTGCTLINKYQD